MINIDSILKSTVQSLLGSTSESLELINIIKNDHKDEVTYTLEIEHMTNEHIIGISIQVGKELINEQLFVQYNSFKNIDRSQAN